MNPLTLLDNLLADYASPRTRRLVHGIIVLAAVIATIALAADGDWTVALASLVAAVYAGANHANTNPSPEEVVDFLEEAAEEDETMPTVVRGDPAALADIEKAKYTDPPIWGDHLRKQVAFPEAKPPANVLPDEDDVDGDWLDDDDDYAPEKRH